MTARRLGVGLALALVVVLAACGVGTTGSADRAPSDRVPFGLLEQEPPTTDDSGSRPGRPVELFLFDSSTGRLRAVSTNLTNTSLASVLFALQDPPEGDAPSGNPLGDSDVIRSANLSRGVVTVDLSDGFNELSGSAQYAALGEIVFTATARPGVGQVAFTLEGAPLAVPKGDGSLEDDPVTRSDYPDLEPDLGAS